MSLRMLVYSSFFFLFLSCQGPQEKHQEVENESVPIDTMVLGDSITYEILTLDELFSTYCCGSEESQDYYKSYTYIVRSKLDTLIMRDSLFGGQNNLIAHDLDGDNYDSGFFLFDGEEPFDWFQSQSEGDEVLIKCNLQRVHYQGMLGSDLIFENCQIVEDN